jgi:HEAT repeat protein
MEIPVTAQKGVLFFSILLVGILVWLFCVIFHPLEPRYQGKRLTEWAKEVCPLEPFSPKDWRSSQVRAQNDRAVAAIQRIGAKAALLRALKLCQARDSWLKRKLEEGIEDWVNRYNDQVGEYNETHSQREWRSEIQVHLTTAADKQYEGGNIIWALGPKATPAIPALIQLLQNQDETFVPVASYALRGIGPNAVLPVMALLHSTNRVIRFRAISALELFGPEARMAVPALVQCLASPDRATRVCAVRSLGTIKAEAPLVVPAIIRCIQTDTNYMDRLAYFPALGSFGTNAKAAAPLLVHFLESDSRFPSPESPAGYFQARVLGALQRIDPETAKPFMEKWKAGLTNDPIRISNSSLKQLKKTPAVQTNSPSP